MNGKSYRNIFKRFSKNNYDWKLLLVVAILVLGGLAFFASSLDSSVSSGFLRNFLKQFLFGVWLGSVIAYILARTDYHQLFKYRRWIIFATLSSLLIIFFPMLMAAGWGVINGAGARATQIAWADSLGFLYQANSAVRWISVFGITNLQPSEFAKIGLLIYFASFLNQKKFNWLDYKKPLWAFILVSISIVFQPDLGSVIVISLSILAAMFVAKVPLKVISIIMGIMILFGSVAIVSTPYRMKRIETWVAEKVCDSGKKDGVLCSNVSIRSVNKDDTLQVNKIKAAISNGGIWGVGYGNSDMKKNIPEVTTDGIIGVVGEEMGYVITAFFLFLYVYFFWRAMQIAKYAPDKGGKALAAGIGFWIVFQAFWNVGGMIGTLPMKGIPLPFVSEGGSAMLVNIAAVGILMNISSKAEIPKKLPKQKKSAIKTKVNRRKIHY